MSYPRAQTLITYGAQRGSYGSFNPYFNNYATGTVGLCYETLLRYDPLKDRYINWLARSAKFTGKKRYTVVLREGIRWSNGERLTPYDVAWNFRLGRFETAFWHDLFANVKSIQTPVSRLGTKVKVKVRVKTRGKTKIKIETRFRVKKVREKVVFTFKKTPSYSRWQTLVWNLALINPRQGRSIKSGKALNEYGEADLGADGKWIAPIGTGPYKLDTDGFDPASRVVWKRRKSWWAEKQKLAPSPKPKYIIDYRLGTVGHDCMSGCIYVPNEFEELSNVHVPGIAGYVARSWSETYFGKSPYHLSDRTNWLTPNTTRKPLNDPAFRKALATAVSINQIVASDYQNRQVLAANPTGLLPTWSKWTARDLVAAKGFSYSTARAKTMLASAGYSDRDGDGFVENEDGSPIDLQLDVPGSDWSSLTRAREDTRDITIESAARAGIRLHRREGSGYWDYYDYSEYLNDRALGNFDLILDDSYKLSDDPWTYFDGNFRLPVNKGGAGQTEANFGRYENPQAWALAQQLEKTPLSRPARRKELMRRLQDIFLTELPNIPLYYNGVWAQWQSKYWTNWPSSGSARQYIPSMWRGYLNMTGIDAITHLKPAS